MSRSAPAQMLPVYHSLASCCNLLCKVPNNRPPSSPLPEVFGDTHFNAAGNALRRRGYKPLAEEPPAKHPVGVF